MVREQSPISKEQFIQYFKKLCEEARQDESMFESFETYCKTIRQIRSRSIKELRKAGMPGYLRSQYNSYLEPVLQCHHIDYLFFKNSTCKLCDFPIEKLQQATIDHIIPVSLGGENALYNKQIAHGKCNVAKGDKIIFKK